MKNTQLLVVLAATVGLSGSLVAQAPNLQSFGADKVVERAATRVAFYDRAQKKIVGQVAIQFGQPVWKKEYDLPGKFDQMTVGKTWRFGKDFWTSMDTDVPIRIGKQQIKPGQYYLAMHRDAKTKAWSLVGLDAAAVRKHRIDASQPDAAPQLFKVAVKEAQAKSFAEKMSVVLHAVNQAQPDRLQLRVTWGKRQFSVPVHTIINKKTTG